MNGRWPAGRWPTSLTRGLVAVAALAPVLLTTVSASHVTSAAASAITSRPAPDYYVSLGDSYSVGYQPAPDPGATAGYTAVVSHATHFRLANFGCAGATITSVLRTKGCTSPTRLPAGAGRVAYPNQTQAAAAEAFIRRHRSSVGLITVSIGGNDITGCATASDPVTCVAGALSAVGRGVTVLSAQLRAAAGRGVPILGLTYPDVFLGLWVYPPSSPDTTAAGLSVAAFKRLFNPTLATAYDAGGGVLVDVTKATGSYVPLTEKTTLDPYGTVPIAVARICELTWFCTRGNIHAKTPGYRLIGNAIVAKYRALQRA